MSVQKSLVGVLVVLVIVAGVGGYFAGSSAVPPPKTITSVVTQTVTTTVAAATVTITSTVTPPAQTITTTVTLPPQTVTVTTTPTPTVTPPTFPLPGWPSKIRFITGTFGGAFYSLAVPMADVIRRELKIEVEVIPGPGAVATPLYISKDQGEIAMTYDYLGAPAKENDISIFNEPLNFTKITAVAGGLYVNYYYFVAQKEFPANNFDDIAKMIKEGKPVRFGGDAAGSSEELMLRYVLRYYGLTYDDVRKAGGTVYAVGDDPAAQAFREKKIDVFYQAGGIPLRTITDVDSTMELKFIAFTDPLIEWLAKNLGVIKGVIPKGSYKNAISDVPTALGTTILIASRELPDSLIYYILEVIAKNKDFIAAAYKAFSYYDPATAWQKVGLWELHPGAIKWFKDKGYMK
ncbi:MAG: TAXI family TRAP transporter solute-binding subunit [Sulfolobales archaeon]